MKTRMKQLIDGKFEYIVPELRLSEAEITITVTENEDYQGDFFFGTRDNGIVKGMLFSDNRRIILSRDSFSGNIISVFYRVDTSGLGSGDSCQGTIIICSNLGEYKIPIAVLVADEAVKTSQGNLHDLRQFSKLAANNYKEAFRLYTKESFKQLLKKKSLHYEEIYRGLSKNPVTYQHMEEFLIATGQKEKVEVSIDKAEKEIFNISSSMKDSIYISRSTWGYLRLEIEVEGGFLDIAKKVITAEDFIGSVYSLEYVISREKLKSGKHYGRIYIKSVYQTLVYEVVVSAEHEYEVNNHRFKNQIKKELANNYLLLLTKQIDYRTWSEQTLKNFTELKENDCYELRHCLYEVYLYYAADNAAQTLAAIKRLKEQTFTPDEYEEEGLYWYLSQQTGLISSDDINVAQRIESLYRKHQDSFLLLWLLIKVNEKLSSTQAKQLYMLERQYEIGCNSPFLYLEVSKLLFVTADLLKKLSPFMIQTLSFAKRYDMLTEEMAMRITYLSTHEKKFSESLYRILVGCYEKYPNKDVLEAICKLVMLGNPRRSQYFKWYKLAVEEDVRITGLYEFYVETVNRAEQIELPREVKLYFAYNNTLGSNKKAFVYASIIQGKDNDPWMYEKYQGIIEEFTRKSLAEHRINEDYAVLYQEFLSHIEEREVANQAAKVAFTYRLYLDDSKVRNVIVCHRPLLNERVYPCIDNVAFIDIYTDDAQIFFEDSHHQRFASTIDYNQHKLFDNKKIIEQCLWQDAKDDGLLLNICGSDLAHMDINIRNLGSFQHIANSEGFTAEYIRIARHKLLDYYDKHAEDNTLKDYLSKIEYREFYKVAPALLVDILIRQNLAQEAFALVCDLGYEKVKATTLFKLCRTIILETEFVENEELIDLAYYVCVHDKYDTVILSYLQDNYIGTVAAMMNINTKMMGFDLDTYAVEEEILLLAMYSRVYQVGLSKVLESYVAHRGKESVIKAFLSFLSYGYFIGDIQIDEVVFKSLEDQLLNTEKDEEDGIITALALLKHYCYCHNLTEKQKENVATLLTLCQKHNLRFAFFADLPQSIKKAFQMEDKVFIEATIAPTANVTLYYSMGHTGEEPEYISEPFMNNYHGIFTREFLLFYGEQLNWYMAVCDGDQKWETEKQTIVMNKPPEEVGSKYQMINQMRADSRLNRDDILEQTMEQYLHQEQLIKDIFVLQE